MDSSSSDPIYYIPIFSCGRLSFCPKAHLTCVLHWDRHKDVAGFKIYMGPNHFPIDIEIPSLQTDLTNNNTEKTTT
jgi:hypothetical protein